MRARGVAASGIVLAGGGSTRFGRDKLVEPLDGRPLVHYAVLALASVTTEVIVAIGPGGAGPSLPSVREAGVPIRVVRDPVRGAGPLVGLLAGLERAAEPTTLAAAGDMPGLVPDVLRALLDALSSGGSDVEALALVLGNRRQPLPIALRTGAATGAARRAVEDGDRSLSALLDRLRTSELDEARWRAWDPGATSLRDVDVPADLLGVREG